MANKIKLDVELNTSIKKAQDLYKAIESGSGFSGSTGKEAQAKFKGNWVVIENLLKQTNLTEEEFKQLNTAIKNVFNVLNTYATKIESLSDKAIELQKKVGKQLEARDRAEERRNKQKDTVADSKVDLINAMGDKQYHTFTKNGNLRGGGALTAETFAKKIAAGEKVGYKDEKGSIQEVSANSDVARQAQAYIQATEKLVNFETKLNQANIALDNLTDKLNKQIEEDRKGNPDGGASLVTDVSNTEKDVRQGMSRIREMYIDEKNKEKETLAIEANTQAHEKNQTTLGKAFKQFTLYHLALRFTKKAIREAVSTIKELDKELTEQAMVTGMTRKETYGLMKTYQELALATGATTKEVASVATEYIKQGKSIKEATLLTEAAVSAAKVARVSVGDSVNYLTTALNGFQLAAEDAMLVSDKFAAVAAASATDYDELAIALSKVASQANLAGMSIDYTTALLTKGLETTREAPETMGTALKTIIARMRELGDYGETLEGDTDINNVEKQLAYVDIALRDTNGELRSTEDVLDELGQKWDTLNKNQQAAVAKALAGTRQQSRLIAMMTDYERVMELQQISERSVGATAAQAGVYLEGMEASLNKITVAWEKIVTGLTSSEVIVNAFSTFGNILNLVGDSLDTVVGQLAIYTAIASIGLRILGTKIQENQLAKLQQKLQLQLSIQKNQELLDERKKLVIEEKITKNAELQAKYAELEKRIEAGDKSAFAELEALRLKDQEAALANDELYQLYLGNQNQLLGQQNSLMQHAYALQGLMQGGQAILTAGAYAWYFIKALITKEDKKQYAQQLKTQALEKKGFAQKLKNAGAKAAESVAAHPYWGWATALAILAAVGIGIGVVITRNTGAENTAKKAAKAVNELSNEIYKLSETTNAIKQITDSYDALDKKIIQTKKDQEEMSSLLEQAADKLSDEEKEHYQRLSSDADKRKYLELMAESNKRQIEIKQLEQLNRINRLSDRGRAVLLNENATDADILKAQSAIYAINNSRLYEHIDLMKKNESITSEQASAIESLTESILSELSIQQAYDYANDTTGTKVKNLVEELSKLEKIQTTINDKQTEISASEILNSDDYNIADKVKAYKQVANALLDTKEAYTAFKTTYQEYELFDKMGEDVLVFIDKMGWGADAINQLGEGWKKLQKAGIDITESTYKSMLTSDGGILSTLEQSGGDVADTIEGVFGTYLEQIQRDGENYAKAYNIMVDIFAETMSVGMLNMGQNIEKLGNSVNSIYEKASQWGSLKESEKMEFMQDNADLFKGDQGQEMLAAFESGNYRLIEEALRNNANYQKRLETQLAQIDSELSIEEARKGEERNEAYIKYLKEWRTKLESSTEMFQADLELLIEQEQKQLDIYREYLEKQQDELEDALEKRKEAYEEYFDAIGQEQENADYEEERNKLITNISKLAGSTDFSSQKQMKELEQQLNDLEKERQKELRERAQEALIEALDKNVEEINEKFDKLLNNEGLLLQNMKNNLETNPNLLSDMLYSAVRDGQMTALNATQYAKDLVSAFESAGADTSDIKEFMESIQNNATFNLANGQTVNIDGEDANMLWAAIQQILVKKGYGN